MFSLIFGVILMGFALSNACELREYRQNMLDAEELFEELKQKYSERFNARAPDKRQNPRVSYFDVGALLSFALLAFFSGFFCWQEPNAFGIAVNGLALLLLAWAYFCQRRYSWNFRRNQVGTKALIREIKLLKTS
jgi:hypothetical protein